VIDFVFTGHCWDPDGSDELRFGWETLERALGAARVFRTSATDLCQVWSEARRVVLVNNDLPDSANVLLLRHPHVLLAPGCLSRLNAALVTTEADENARLSVAFGYDSAYPAPGAAIDYATVRGIERYAASLPAVVSLGDADKDRLIGLTTAGALRATEDWLTLKALNVHSAFGHDFSGYHSGRREEAIPLVPLEAKRVLDVGGGAGGFLRALKSTRECEVHLAEFSPQACSAARDYVDRVWQGDFMSQNFDVKFDCITFLDVLEHTENPRLWLSRALSLLSPDGCIVASIPNVGHWSVVADLLEGRWDYAPVGIHCITHLRFFTLTSVKTMLDKVGLVIEHIETTQLKAPEWWQVSNMSGQLRVDDESLDTYAFIFRAGRKVPPSL
jgi:2-polyprenyl-3-methyl-5-hydroxy-6-metoxy-1,4-benzoquinol methylase